MTVLTEIFDGVRGGSIEVGQVTSSNPAAIAAGAEGTATLTITGAKTTDVVFLNPRGLAAGLVMKKATVTAADTVTVTLLNPTASSIDDAASDYSYVLVKTA